MTVFEVNRTVLGCA